MRIGLVCPYDLSKPGGVQGQVRDLALRLSQDGDETLVFAPGLPDEAALRLACTTLRKPFNYVAGVGRTRFSLAELQDIGVRRVTIGTSFARCALAAALHAAHEVLEHGTFGYLDGLPTVKDFNELIAPEPHGV